MTDPLKAFSIRLPASLAERIAQAAEADDRSLNAMVVRLLEQALAGLPARFQEARQFPGLENGDADAQANESGLSS